MLTFPPNQDVAINQMPAAHGLRRARPFFFTLDGMAIAEEAPYWGCRLMSSEPKPLSFLQLANGPKSPLAHFKAL